MTKQNLGSSLSNNLWAFGNDDQIRHVWLILYIGKYHNLLWLAPCSGPRYEKMFRSAERKETIANLQAVQSLVRWDALRYVVYPILSWLCSHMCMRAHAQSLVRSDALLCVVSPKSCCLCSQSYMTSQHQRCCCRRMCSCMYALVSCALVDSVHQASTQHKLMCAGKP